MVKKAPFFLGKISILLTIFFISLLFLISPHHLKAATSEIEKFWRLIIVDKTQNVGLHNSIVTDSKGAYLISYTSLAEASLKLAKSSNNGKDWQLTKIDSGNIDYDTSLAIIPAKPEATASRYLSDTYLIAYFDNWPNFNLKLAISKDDGLNWQKVIVDKMGGVGEFNSLAVDQVGSYLISYFVAGKNKLNLAKSTDGANSWNFITVDEGGFFTGMHNSLTVDNKGNYLISYVGGDGLDLRFAKSQDGGKTWQQVTVDEKFKGWFSSIAVDSHNNYLISYQDASNASLKFAQSKDSGKTWKTMVLDKDSGEVGYESSLVIDKNDNYLIAYYDSAKKLLKLAKSPDGGVTWQKEAITQIVHPAISIPDISLAVDKENSFLVSYFDPTDSLLKLAIK